MDEQEILTAVATIRVAWQKSDAARDAGLPTTLSGVKRFDNLRYGDDPKYNLLDIYLPHAAHAKLPVIINIHGGGWVYGTKETYQFYGLNLAQNGFAFINASYRLGPDVVYPSELTDMDQVFHWIAANHVQYNLDVNNVFIVGDSAGAQMAEQLLAIYTNPLYRRYFDYTVPKLQICAAALNSGAYFITDPGMITGAVQAYLPLTILQQKRIELQVENFLTPALPPLFIMTANQDFLRDKTWQLTGFLRAKQIFHETHMYGNTHDPRGHVFHIDQKDPLAQECNLAELNFFRRYLK
ncbi:alpha/beta hydrolase [Loigolactobacillus coryniformis]|uniref:alpha/beta hydrolase n=1 Tax=Loigolactobacillus coryniformis TaxID=1610 RepID=UPI00345DAC68